MINNEENVSIEDKGFSEWIQHGIDMGWITEPFCATHDGDPYMDEEEAREWEDGGDPCCHVVKFKDV